MTETNVDYAVLVIADEDTVGRMEILAEKAAENGARIAETFAFPVGAAASSDDLIEVEAVVDALSRAVATRTSLWAPFPLQDLCREAHIRRLSLALQRHGLNLLLGRDMSPCPTEGGYSAIDAALRDEVKAVDDLDQAALARSASRTLGAEIEAALAKGAQHPARRGERIYSTRETAGLLGQPVNWISWALREDFFTYADDSPIEPLRVGRNRRRRFTVSMIREMAKSCQRRGVLNRRECERVLAELSRTER
jgi:hypothetical protein